MLGVGALGEAVWLEEGMDASAEALAATLPPDCSPHTPQTHTGQRAISDWFCANDPDYPAAAA